MRYLFLLFLSTITAQAAELEHGLIKTSAIPPTADAKAAAQLPAELADYFRCRGHKKCEALARHLRRDSAACMPNPQLTLDTYPQGLWRAPKNVVGSIRYLGTFWKRYSYSISQVSSGNLLVSTTIAIKNRSEYSETEIGYMQNKLDAAGFAWDAWFNTPGFTFGTRKPPFSLRFKFRIVGPNEPANFYVRLVREDSRGPYDTTWSLQWSEFSITHEMGHMMGLDDEYKNGLIGSGSDKECVQDSIMCDNPGSHPLDIHFYLILRRLACE